MLVDIHGTKKKDLCREEEGDVGSYIIITLLMIFNGEPVERYHLNPVIYTTESGIEVKEWELFMMATLENKCHITDTCYSTNKRIQYPLLHLM